MMLRIRARRRVITNEENNVYYVQSVYQPSGFPNGYGTDWSCSWAVRAGYSKKLDKTTTDVLLVTLTKEIGPNWFLDADEWGME